MLTHKVLKNKTSNSKTYGGQLIEASASYILEDIELTKFRGDENLENDMLSGSNVVFAHSDDTSIEFESQLGLDFLKMNVPKSPLVIFGQLINGEYAQEVTGTPYMTLFSFIDSNSSENGVPIKMAIDAYLNDGDTYDIRLYDLTNNNVLCEKIGMSNLTRGIIEIGRIDGITTDKAVLEIQGRAYGTKNQAYIYSALIEYD